MLTFSIGTFLMPFQYRFYLNIIMKNKLIKKYFFTTIALLMISSISYASSCANLCISIDSGALPVTMNAAMNHDGHESRKGSGMGSGTNSCESKEAEDSSSDDGQSESHSSGSVACDSEYVVSSKTLTKILDLRPLITDFDVIAIANAYSLASHESLSLKTRQLTEKNLKIVQVSIYIQNKTLLI